MRIIRQVVDRPGFRAPAVGCRGEGFGERAKWPIGGMPAGAEAKGSVSGRAPVIGAQVEWTRQQALHVDGLQGMVLPGSLPWRWQYKLCIGTQCKQVIGLPRVLSMLHTSTHGGQVVLHSSMHWRYTLHARHTAVHPP